MSSRLSECLTLFHFRGQGIPVPDTDRKRFLAMDWMRRSQTSVPFKPPAIDSRPAAAQVGVERAAASDRGCGDSGAMRVLVVDDNPAICRLAADIAERLGLEVAAAADPDSFLRSYVDLAPSIVLLDLHLPGCDGLALLNELYRQHSQARIILISGADRRVLKSASEFGRSRGLSIAGALEKPFAVESLEGLLCDLSAMEIPPVMAAEGGDGAGGLEEALEVVEVRTLDPRSARRGGEQALSELGR